MTRLLVIACLAVLVAVVAIQGETQTTKRAEVEVVKKALEHAKEKTPDAQSKRKEFILPVQPSLPPAQPTGAKGSGYSSDWWPESWSSVELNDSWSELQWSSDDDLSEREWESWGPLPSWVPDSWLGEPDDKEDEDKKPEPGDRKTKALKARARRKTRAVKLRLADAHSKRQEHLLPGTQKPPKLTEPEGSGSSSDDEWNDFWSDGGSDLWEWPESWGPLPSWVPDSWFGKREDKAGALPVKSLLAVIKNRK